MEFFLFLAAILLCYANGANDNFKGVATLFGSGTTDYKRALYWATATTLLGSFVALSLSHGLVAAFSGKGLVPAALVQMPAFLISVAAGAAQRKAPCRSAIASNEISVAPSVTATMKPVSSIGKKPFGTMM